MALPLSKEYGGAVKEKNCCPRAMDLRVARDREVMCGAFPAHERRVPCAAGQIEIARPVDCRAFGPRGIRVTTLAFIFLPLPADAEVFRMDRVVFRGSDLVARVVLWTSPHLHEQGQVGTVGAMVGAYGVVSRIRGSEVAGGAPANVYEKRSIVIAAVTVGRGVWPGIVSLVDRDEVATYSTLDGPNI